MRSLRVVTAEAAPTLCRTSTRACVACCRGAAVPETRLAAALRRQTTVFAQLFREAGHPPALLRLVLYELRARRGLPLVLAPLFCLPGVGPLLRGWFARRSWCAFLGFPDGDESRPGCLLHPSRWGGRDVRPRAAFALLPGMRCGEPGYACPSADLYRHAGVEPRRRFRERTRGLGWFAYSRAVEGAESELLDRPPG